MEETVGTVLIPQISTLQPVFLHCLCIHMHTMRADVHICVPIYDALSVYYAIIFVCPCVCVYYSLHLSSQQRVHKMNHLPHTKAKSWQSVFHIAKRLHNMIFSVLRTHQHTQTCLQIEGGTTRALTILSLSLSCLLQHTLSMCRPTVQTQTSTCTHSLGTTPPTVDSKLDPYCPEAERQNDRERDQWTQWCVCYLHPNPQFSLTLCLHPPFPSCKLQIQQSVSSTCSLVNIHANMLFLSLSASLSIWQKGCAFKSTWRSPAKWLIQSCPDEHKNTNL